MQLRLDQIKEITQGEFLVRPSSLDREALMLTWDSRQVIEGSLYVALVGERVDGHSYVKSALESGAVCVLVSQKISDEDLQVAQVRDCAIICVKSGERAIQDLAGAWRDMIPATVIGITGSVGKTTTKSLIRQMLSQRYNTCATKGNFNNELGAPYTLLSADKNCEMLVMEMGMSSLGEIEQICSYARPDMGLITNIGTSHLEFLKTRKNVACAKSELIVSLPDKTGQAFLPAESDFYEFMCQKASECDRHIRVVSYGGTNPEHDVYATDVKLDKEGRPSFVLHIGEQQKICSLSLRGVHNVDNACGAAAVGRACGLTMDEIVQGLHDTMPEAGRQEFKETACHAMVIDDTYNASPVSMKAALSMIQARSSRGRKIAILGDMGELGDETEHGHRIVGEHAATVDLDYLICVGPYSQHIMDAALESGMDSCAVVHVDSVDNVFDVLPQLHEGDTVLCKASHYMGLNKIVEGLIG